MRIERLFAHGFRNLRHLDIASSAKTIVLLGDNGQGKTNILEALYVCATGRSFRHVTNGNMVQHGSQQAAVRAVFTRAAVRHEVAVAIDQHRRRIQVDGRAVRQSLNLLRMLNIVAFFPDDLIVAKGAPEARRRFFDRAVANSQPNFAQVAIDYQRVLQHRNSLLRQPNAPDRGILAVYDQQMVALASAIHAARQATLAELLPVAQQHFEALIPELTLNIALRSGIVALDAPPGVGCRPDAGQAASGSTGAPQAHAHASIESAASSVADFEKAFAQALLRGYSRDRARGSTGEGPHRADLHCLLGGRDARLFASQGQQRSMILALKLAEVVCLRQKRGFAPILVMDDVSSELDASRTRFLFEVVQAHAGQSWISATGQIPWLTTGAKTDDVQTVRVHQGLAS